MKKATGFFMFLAEIFAILFMYNNLPHTVTVIFIMATVLVAIVLSVFIFIDILKD